MKQANLVLYIAALVISLIFSYIPPIANAFEALSGRQKRSAIGAALVVITIGTAIAAHWSLHQAVEAGLTALAVNQSTYLITPRRR